MAHGKEGLPSAQAAHPTAQDRGSERQLCRTVYHCEGHTAQRLEKDYGYDLLLFTFDAEGYAEPGLVCLQLKAEETLPADGSDYFFDLDTRDYNLWMLEKWPVILILFDASRRKAYWLHVQDYFHEESTRRPKKGAKTVRVRVPKRQTVNRRAIVTMRDLKQRARSWINGGD